MATGLNNLAFCQSLKEKKKFMSTNQIIFSISPVCCRRPLAWCLQRIHTLERNKCMLTVTVWNETLNHILILMTSVLGQGLSDPFPATGCVLLVPVPSTSRLLSWTKTKTRVRLREILQTRNVHIHFWEICSTWECMKSQNSSWMSHIYKKCLKAFKSIHFWLVRFDLDVMLHYRNVGSTLPQTPFHFPWAGKEQIMWLLNNLFRTRPDQVISCFNK